MRIVLTGASGFLGSALAAHWAAKGHHLALLVRPSPKPRPRLLPPADCIDVFTIRSDQDIFDVVGMFRPDVVVHTACAYGRQQEGPSQLLDANLRWGVCLLDAVLKDGCGRKSVGFLNAGSILPPELNLYALSKAQFADWGRMICRNHPGRLQFVDLRLQHFYGPGDDLSKFTSQVIHACHRNQPELALTSGLQRRDFVYIDDVVEAFDTVLGRLPDLEFDEILEIGSGHAVQIKELVQRVHALLGSSTRLLFGARPSQPGDRSFDAANVERMRNLGWVSRFDLDTGLKRTIRKEFDL